MLYLLHQQAIDCTHEEAIELLYVAVVLPQSVKTAIKQVP
jgi:hypothetical protein